MLTVIPTFLRSRPALALSAALLLTAPAGFAQGGLGDIVYSVATTTKDASGRDWAYLLWQATTPSLLSGRTFAVYAKPGDPTNNAPYVRLSVVQLQTDARSIEPLLRRAENIGENSLQLQQDMLQLFASLMPSNSISRGDQLSAVIRGSLVDAGHYNNLVLLARNHPGVALCLGFADAQLLAAPVTTFEIRNFDLAKNQDVAVVGRVTVDVNHPTVLPAPGPPVLVPDLSPRGDINLKFRWATPDALRRLSLLHFGYSLWRVPKDFFLASGWANPPTLAQLLSANAANSNLVRRVNRLPIVPPKTFTLAEAANVSPPGGDTSTMFIADDDGRFKPGYVNYGFTNGAQFYYFATARDILGREGAVSPGTVTTVCDRMPPPIPTRLAVVNDYSYNTNTAVKLQALRVIWNQVTNFSVTYYTNKANGKILTNASDTVTNYWIYRWTSVTQMNALSGDMSNHLIAVVPHRWGARTNSYLDAGPTSPSTNNYGTTFWYTVRAGDAGACGQNLSANSGPAYGVLRDRTGPAAPIGTIDFNCPQPWVDFVQARLTETRNSDPASYNFNLTCARLSPQIAWAQFQVVQLIYNPTGGGISWQTNDLGMKFYSPGDLLVSMPWAYSTQVLYASSVFYCRAGTFDGKTSDYTNSVAIPSQGYPLPDAKTVMEVDFAARTIATRAIIGREGLNQGGPCRGHDPIDPGTGLVTPINICFHPTATSREWRLYQRVDDGPLTLYAQGQVTNPAVNLCIPNDTLLANPGTICFYVQLLDENGNASPLRRFGCLDIGSPLQIPTPLLSPISASGNTNDPGMNLVWFCPPYGLDRFEVWIGASTTNANPTLSPLLGFSNAPAVPVTFTNNGSNYTYNFHIYRTPHIGPGFGNNTPQFAVPASIEIGRTYAVFLKAVGKNGAVGEPSNIETFLWSPTNVPGPMVPWPARPLPTTNGTFPAFAFFLSPTNSNGLLRGPDTSVGVLIGFSALRTDINLQKKPQSFFGQYDPNAFVLTNGPGDKLFPIALYRYQMPNPNFPTVSGDITQVSPLMENIAYGFNASQTIIYDPFVSLTANAGILFAWLLDTQPQISGARYKYLVVRFGANREIDQIIPSNPVEVP
jgi:hypothetical protein